MKKKIGIVNILIIIILGACTYWLGHICQKEIREDTHPYRLSENGEILIQDTKQGMTMKDEWGNEWVWIVVPKSKVFLTAQHDNDYEKIENDIQQYTKDYSNENYEDKKEDQSYQEQKEKTLSSIYQYGGFWISRYEVGTTQMRKDKKDPLTEPLSQANLYVYNYVTFSQAQEMASYISDKKYISSLLFGFQNNLVCKFIEENGYLNHKEKITKEMINANSSLWGNYYHANFKLDRGKYSENYGKDYQDISENTVKKAYKNWLLTTGASEQNKICNIYDFAGNVSEWTLEYEKQDKKSNIIRDGSFYFNYGGNDPANGRYKVNSNSSSSSYGFRIMCIK